MLRHLDGLVVENLELMLPREHLRKSILEVLLVEHLSQELDPLRIHGTSDMNDAAVALLVLIGLGFGLTEYEALLAVVHMPALDEEFRRLGTQSKLLDYDHITYLLLT